jgi:basic membrane protein A and related proteins
VIREKRLFSVFSVVVTAALVLGACGSGTTPTTKPAATGTAAATTGATTGATGTPATSASATAATGGFEIPDIEQGKFNVAMVLIGPHDDGGWSQAHYEGLQYVQANVSGTHVAYIENVPEGADSETTFRSLARKGFNLIIGTSFGYMEPMNTVATDFPSAMFVHLTGYESNGTNFGNLFGAMEDMKYLAGMLAGSRAKKDGNPKLGYMATFPIPEEIRLGNAILLGAKKTCPECTLDVRWINTWHDPITEKNGASSLFDGGDQVVFTGADTGANTDVAQTDGKWAVTYDHPASCHNDACLTAPYWIWGPVYADIVKNIQAGTYKPGYQYFDADTKAMGLFGFMDGETPKKGITDLPAADVQMVRDTLAKMLAGQFTRFDVFTGPINDNTGKQVLAAGQKLQQSDLDQFPPGAPGNACTVCMHWLAEGINGTIPNQ